MSFEQYSRKDTGNIGERVAAEYLHRLGFSIIGRNIVRKTGELDVVAQKSGVLHIVEVKAARCSAFPGASESSGYNPAENLHSNKIRKVLRTAEWYVRDIGWEGEWQIDGALVWIRTEDGKARIQYYPQIL